MDAPSDWQISKHQLVQRGKYLFETGELSDCNFLVGEEPQQQVLRGHKLFLGMSSPVFNAMFYGSMAETTDPIPITDIQPETFKTLLKYIYTDKVDLVSFESVYRLGYCANKYMLPYLVEECTKYLSSNLSPNIACKTYEFAKLLEEPSLMQACLNLICTKTTEVLNKPSWEGVELDTLLTIFKQDELNIDTEMELLAALERWAKAKCARKSLNPSDPKFLRSVIGNALSKIRFLTLTPQQFAEGIQRSLFLTKDEAFSIFMNISLNASNIFMSEEFSTCIVKRVKTEKPKQYCPYCGANGKPCNHIF